MYTLYYDVMVFIALVHSYMALPYHKSEMQSINKEGADEEEELMIMNENNDTETK